MAAAYICPSKKIWRKKSKRLWPPQAMKSARKRKQTSLMAAFAKTKDLDEAAKKRLRHRRAKMSAAK